MHNEEALCARPSFATQLPQRGRLLLQRRRLLLQRGERLQQHPVSAATPRCYGFSGAGAGSGDAWTVFPFRSAQFWIAVRGPPLGDHRERFEGLDEVLGRLALRPRFDERGLLALVRSDDGRERVDELSAYGDRLLLQSASGTVSDRVVLRWMSDGATPNTIVRAGQHALTDWISAGSQRVGEWVVRRVATSVEASRVVQ